MHIKVDIRLQVQFTFVNLDPRQILKITLSSLITGQASKKHLNKCISISAPDRAYYAQHNKTTEKINQNYFGKIAFSVPEKSMQHFDYNFEYYSKKIIFHCHFQFDKYSVDASKVLQVVPFLHES